MKSKSWFRKEKVEKKYAAQGIYQTAKMTSGKNRIQKNSQNIYCDYIGFCKPKPAKTKSQNSHGNKYSGSNQKFFPGWDYLLGKVLSPTLFYISL